MDQYLRRNFLVPHRRAVRSITETLAAHGETLPLRADATSVAAGVKTRLERYRGDAEEATVLGSAPTYIMPVMRTQKVRCSEIRNCGNRSCPSFSSDNLRCWMRQVPLAAFTPVSDPEAFRESVLECLGCEVFPSAGMVVVRETPGGKVVTRESVHPIAALSSEAALAMEVVNLYDHMKIMTVTNGLTGLFNRREFSHALRKEAEVSGHNFISSSTFPVNLTVSIGIYSSEDGNVSEDQMVSLADEAAYLAKNSGKNRVVVKAVF